MPQPAKADATGRLATTPLADVLVSLLDRRLDGSLIIETPDGSKSAFSFRAGRVVKAKTATPVIRLGDLLVDTGVVTRPQVGKAVKLAKKDGQLIGQALLELQHLEKSALQEALAEQLARRLEWACGLPAASVFGFYGGVDFLTMWGNGPIVAEPLAIIWRCMQRYSDPRRIDAVLERLGDRPLRLHRAAALDRFRFDQNERHLIERLESAPGSLGALLGECDAADHDTLKRFIHVLALTRHLDLGDQRLPAGVDPRVTVRSRPGSTHVQVAPDAARETQEPASAKRQEPVATRSATSSSSPTLRQRGFRSVRGKVILSNPSPAPGDSIPPGDRTSEVRIREAEARIRPRPSSAPGQAGSSRRPPASAADEFRKAEQLAKRSDFEAALPPARAAHSAEPDNVRHGALYAYVMAQCGLLDSSNEMELLGLCARAVREDPSSTVFRTYRARVLQRMGRDDEALKDFKIVLQADPHHIDAKREIRLYSKQREQTERGGLFGIFRRGSSEPPESK